MKRNSTLASLLVVCIGGFGSPVAQAKSHFTKGKLEVPGTILWFDTGDLDGDGRTDLVVSYRRGKGPIAKRFLAVFFRGDLGYSDRPNLAIEAPSNAAIFDLGDVLDAPGEEIVYLTRVGVYAIPIVDRKTTEPERVLRGRPLVGRAEEEDFVHWDFVRRLEPKGPISILVPRLGPFEIYRREGTEWKVWSRISLSPQSYYDASHKGYRRSARGGSPGSIYAYRITTIIPMMWFLDQTGDGRVDLVTSYEDRVEVYPAGEDGRFAERPSYRRWFRMRTPEEEKRNDIEVNAQVVDMDADGIADLCLTKIGGGLTSLKTESQLYRGTKGGGFEKAPSQVFKDEGFATLITFVDVDGDGRLEMVHPKSEVSLLSMSKMLMSSELSLELRIRRASRDKGGFFESRPSEEIDATLGLDFKVGGAIRGAFPLFGMDLDGDGRNDAIFPMGTESMGIHHGQPDKSEMLESDPLIKLSAPASQHTIIVPPKVGSTSKPDVILFHTDLPELDGQITVFRNAS